MNKLYSITLKVSVSLVILIYLIYALDFRKAIDALININPYYLIFAFLLLFISLFLMVLKWKIILNKYVQRNPQDIFLIYWAADFINLFGLGAFGSEVYKMISFRKKKVALLTSLFDKFISFIWFIFLVASISVSYLLIKDNNYLVLYISLLIYSMLTISLLMIYSLKDKYVECIKNKKIASILKNIHVSKKELLYHSIYSLLFIFNTVFIYKVLFYSLGINIGVISLLVFVPLLNIAITLPISVEGLGIRELLFIEFAKISSISLESALACSLLIFIIGLAYRLTGVVPFFILKLKS